MANIDHGPTGRHWHSPSFPDKAKRGRYGVPGLLRLLWKPWYTTTLEWPESASSSSLLRSWVVRLEPMDQLMEPSFLLPLTRSFFSVASHRTFFSISSLTLVGNLASLIESGLFAIYFFAHHRDKIFFLGGTFYADHSVQTKD